jgi:hypothetical protein
MGTAALTSESPAIGQDAGAADAVESACVNDAPLMVEEAPGEATLDRDDDVTVVVPKGRLRLLHKRTTLWILTAFGLITVGVLATGMVRLAMARRPTSAQVPSLPTKVTPGAVTNQPAPNVPSSTPLASATMAKSAEPKTARPTIADSPIPIATASAASAQKPGRTTETLIPQAPVEAEPALAVCQDALVKGDTAAITQGCDRALEIDATLAMPILAWAKRELDRGNVKAAVTWARRLLRANDHLAEAYLIVGVAEQLASHGSAAKTAYRRYLELAPKGRYARDVRLSLAAL